MISTLYRGYVQLRRRAALLGLERPRPVNFDPAAVRDALLVVVGLLGDSLMCLPAITAARHYFPKARLTGLVTRQNHSLLQMASIFDDFVVVSGSAFSLRPSAFSLERQAATKVRSGRYDLAVIFLGDDYAPLLTRAGIPVRVCVQESSLAVLGTHCYSIGNARTWGPSQRQAAWTALGLSGVTTEPRLTAPQAARESLAQKLAQLAGDRLLILHPFGRTADQWWPERLARQLVREAAEGLGARTILIGGATERSATTREYRDVAAAVALDLVGQLSAEELTALMDRAHCVVSTDSGPYHLSGTQGRPTVGLFRASRPEHAHRYRSAIPIVSPAVRDCERLCRWDRCRLTPCAEMAAIFPDAVLDAVARQLSGRPGRERFGNAEATEPPPAIH